MKHCTFFAISALCVCLCLCGCNKAEKTESKSTQSTPKSGTTTAAGTTELVPLTTMTGITTRAAQAEPTKLTADEFFALFETDGTAYCDAHVGALYEITGILASDPTDNSLLVRAEDENSTQHIYFPLSRTSGKLPENLAAEDEITLRGTLKSIDKTGNIIRMQSTEFRGWSKHSTETGTRFTFTTPEWMTTGDQTYTLPKEIRDQLSSIREKNGSTTTTVVQP